MSSIFERRQRVVEFLKDRGWEIIGEGMFAEVFGHPQSNQVIRITTALEDDKGIVFPPDGWLVYAKLCQTKLACNPHALKIFKLKVFDGFYVARLERLEATIEDCDDRDVQEFFEKVCIALNNPGGVVSWELLVSNPELSDLLNELRKTQCALDLHNCNAMIREDGTFVVTDPLY